MRFRLLAVTLVAALYLAMPSTAAYAALTSKDVEKELMCQCGCTMVVDVCDCETANQIRAKIAELIGQGQNKGQILAYFVGQYGEKMLASPTKKGFNLVAWVTPFVAVVAGATGLFFLLRAWVRRGRGRVEEAVSVADPLPAVTSEEDRRRVEEELRKFNDEGSV